ncbi:MAG: exopolysaccharide Pel transporter PelG [Lachnospiraceae bacterium]|nr:exopolysaccharide Pel transporter PelG [Lachnospiraceae bacterium]
MAGIGFELKKIFKGDSIVGKIMGGAYATMVTVGPTLLVIAALNLLYFLLPYAEITYQDREVLSSTILYVFIFSLCLSGPVNILLSRYVADKVYEEKYEELSSSIEFGNQLLALLLAVFGIPFAFRMYYEGGLSIPYIAVSYLFFTGLAFTFYYMTFITLLKEYRKITYSFLAGLLLGILAAWITNYRFGVGTVNAILFGLMVGFNLIAVFLYVIIRDVFPRHAGGIKEIRRYAWEHKLLIGANLLYLLGLYVHNWVFWFQSEFRVEIASVFICAPVYDEATFLAMLTDLPFLVVFVVNVETKFHSAYQVYCQCVIGGGRRDIIKSKFRMERVLREELLYIIQLQTILLLIIYMVMNILIPRLGMDGTIFSIYPVLAVGYFIIYLVQGMMIFQFYLDDAKGAFLTGLFFFLGIFLGSLVSVHFPASLCGTGVIAGGFAGFTFVYFRLRYLLHHLDAHMYCRFSIVKEKRTGRKTNNANMRIYKNEKQKTEGKA